MQNQIFQNVFLILMSDNLTSGERRIVNTKQITNHISENQKRQYFVLYMFIIQSHKSD
jgi:hypothetical protein